MEIKSTYNKALQDLNHAFGKISNVSVKGPVAITHPFVTKSNQGTNHQSGDKIVNANAHYSFKLFFTPNQR